MYLTSWNPTSQRQSGTKAWTETGLSELKQASADIFLVGAVHLDPCLCSLILDVLNILSPAAITVEISQFSLDFRQKNESSWLRNFRALRDSLAPELQGHSSIRLLERQLMMPGEWMAASKYGKKHGVPVLPVDSSTLSRKELSLWEKELLNIENLKNLVQTTDLDLDEYFRSSYSYAEKTLNDHKNYFSSTHPLRWLEDAFWRKREHILSRRIRRVFRLKMPIVHIGGWMHLIQGSPWQTISDLLSDIKPARIFIKNPRLSPDHRSLSLYCKK